MRPKVGGVPTPLREASSPPVNLSTLDTNMSARSGLLSQDRELLLSYALFAFEEKINEILLNFAYNRMVNMQQSMTLVLLRPYVCQWQH